MALDNQDLEAIRQLMQEELKPIKSDLEELKEGMIEVRESVASIVDWIDEAEHTVEIRFPVKKQQA